MDFSIRDKKILLMFLGVLFLGLSYFFVYRPQLEEARQLEAENIPLQTRLEELTALAADKKFFVEETQNMQNEIQQYCQKFPADILSEDGIVLAQEMEKAMNMQISNVGIGDREYIYSLGGTGETDDVQAGEEQTLMEEGDAAIQEQIAAIEEDGGETPEESASGSGAQLAALFAPTLYRTQDTLQFTCTYSSLKRAVKFLGTQSGRMTLNNVNAGFDPGTGNLTGTMTVNFFSMTGTGNRYQEPDAGSVAYGTDNIFGTVDNSDADAAAETPKEQSAQDGAEGNTQ